MGVQLTAESNLAELGNGNFSDSELVYHVRNALKAALEGDTDSYNHLVGVMNRGDQRLLPDEVALLVTCLKSLTGAVSCIDVKHHQSLLAAILGMKLWNYSTDVMDALVELIISLAASNGKYVDLCLNMLVDNFVPPESFMEALKKPFGVRRKDQVLDRVHSTLRDIAELVPLSPLRLEKIIEDRMPQIYFKEPLLVMFVENMLRLESGAMGELVGSTMLVAIVDRLIDLDVEIPWDDILRDDFGKGIFEMELEDLEGPADDPLQDLDERKMWLEKMFGDDGPVAAKKLDSLMVLTFEHLKSSHESGRLHQVFETLLQSFQRTVLTAYKSKFAQFVIFYACSLDPDYCGTRFADALIYIFENSAYPEWRMSAVAYLASYLSRAKFISASLVADMLERLASWCYSYSENLNEDINPKAHKVYYAGCQAIMYVLCFRMRAMLAVPRLRSKLVLTRIADILRHKSNPLKVCLPSIVEEFIRLAKSTRLLAVPDNPVANGMLESDFSVAFGGPQRLDMFFPFDPCLLKKSDRFIRPNFVYWSMVRSTYEDDDEDEDEDEASSDEDIAEFSGRVNMMEIYDDETLGSVDNEASDHDLDGFDYSLDKMSITPKNPPTRLLGSDLRGGGYMQMPSRIRPSTSPESL